VSKFKHYYCPLDQVKKEAYSVGVAEYLTLRKILAPTRSESLKLLGTQSIFCTWFD
jgi:hypothetical protein